MPCSYSNPVLLTLSSNLWHQHLGHVSYPHLLQLSKVADGISLSKQTLKPCVGCAKRKAKIKSIHSRRSQQSSTLFSLVHSDLSGPMSISSISNSKFLAVFVEDYYCYCFIYLLKLKSDFSRVLNSFIQLIFTQYGVVIKTLHSDCGGEFESLSEAYSFQMECQS
jgi:hypothetical protein